MYTDKHGQEINLYDILRLASGKDRNIGVVIELNGKDWVHFKKGMGDLQLILKSKIEVERIATLKDLNCAYIKELPKKYGKLSDKERIAL